MSGFPYRRAGPIAPDRLGLIVLQVDETIEHDFRRLFGPEVALHVTRVPSGAELTPETIAEMAAHLPKAAALLPPAARFGAVGYACTSGATLIGPERVAELVAGACRTRAVTDPMSAALAAMRALGARRVGLVSPYVAGVVAPMRAAFEAAGHAVPAALSFGEKVEARVARIDPASIAAAARELAGRALAGGAPVDAIFLSCTNLRTLDIIAPLEAELGLPVVSSNQALAWHMAALAGVPAQAARGPGRLMACRAG